MRLYLFSRPTGLPNLSPFCVKLETYLRMADIEYTPVFGFDNKANRKRQMPFVELDGEIIGDSTLIIDELVRRNGDKVDAHLSSEQRNIAQAFQTMLENHFTKFIVWFRWCDEQGWSQFRERAFAATPWVVRLLISPLIAKKIRKNLYAEGTGRLTPNEMIYLAKKDLDALSAYLSIKPFFFGDRPSTLDAIIFATVGNIILSDIDMALRNLALKYDNLVLHSKRMQQTYFSDLK